MDYEGFKTLIAGLGDGDKNTALEVRTLFTHLIQSIFLPGDIKYVNCTQEEIDRDFDETGLGRGQRIGWARCNGLNGTKPITGRVLVGEGDGFPVGNPVGNNKITLTAENIPELDATFPVSDADNGGGTKVYIVATDVQAAGSKSYSKSVNKNSENTAISVMQAGLITLCIQKV